MYHISYQKEIEFLFLQSALTLENSFNTTEEILAWVQKRNEEVEVNIKELDLMK